MNNYKIFVKLYRRLFSQSVFYIPSELIVDGVQDMVAVQIDQYTDRLLYLAKDRRSKPLQNPETFENIIFKRFQLQKTVSFLLKEQTRMDEESFSYLMEKYMEHVNIACYVSKLLFDNIKGYFPNEPLVVYNTFLVQQNTINEHRESLIKTLKIADDQPYVLENLLQMSLMQNPAFKETLSLQELRLQPDSLQLQTTDCNGLISDEQAENFLLETVFSIPLEKTEKK